jgi:hypothetical protein
MRLGTLIQALIAALFGLGCLSFGIVSFSHELAQEQLQQSKFDSVRSGSVQAETLVVLQKYVNPGKHGLSHIVFKSDRQPKVNLTSTVDFFNSVQVGNNVAAYYFPDGYFIPQNARVPQSAGKWFLLSLGLLMGAGAFAVSRATIRRG